MPLQWRWRPCKAEAWFACAFSRLLCLCSCYISFLRQLDKSVSCTVNSTKMHRVRGVLFELLPQFQYLVINRPGRGVGIVAPNLSQQLLAAKHSIRIVEKEAKQFEFVGSQHHLPPALCCPHPRKVHLDVAESNARHKARFFDRRIAACTRASSSRGLNGLVT